MIAIIGGSGLYDGMKGLEDAQQKNVETPYGTVACILCRLNGEEVVFLSRHGDDSKVPPHRIPFKANIRALKELGVTRILATSAVGTLLPEIALGDLVVPDQFIDFTKQTYTFYEGGESGLVHINLTEPFCPVMREKLFDTGRELGMAIHGIGTYACIEGPQFETLAEARMLRSWGGTLAGMTAVPEAKLARELEICYQVVAVPVDNPAQRGGEPSHAQTLKIIGESTDRMARLFSEIIGRLPKERECPCSRALHGATG